MATATRSSDKTQTSHKPARSAGTPTHSESAALAGAGLCVGALAAAIGLLLGRGTGGIADVVERIYLLQAFALPATLALTYWLALDQPDSRDLYSSLAPSLLGALLGALLGTAAAALTFLLFAVNGPVILGGLDATAFSAAVWSRIVWNDVALVLGVTLLAALALAAWTYSRAQVRTGRQVS